MNRLKIVLLALSCLLNAAPDLRHESQAALGVSSNSPAAVAPLAESQEKTASPEIAAALSATNAIAADATAAPALQSPPRPAPPSPSNPLGAAAESARNIRFQFDGIPYGDVLERFAQMAKKPLVANTNIQGTLTFNDPKPYTYEEALDTLNLMLSMKEMTLVESDHYLRLVPLKQLSQLPVRILRGLDQTGDARPGEIVTVLLEIKNLDAKEAAEAITSMLSNAGSVAPMSRGGGLIITDRLANIQRIRSLITMLDTQTVAERQMKTHTLLHASGAVVADLINRTFGSSTAPKRTQFNPQTKHLDTLPPDPNDYVTAVYDDASRTLVLFGPRERVALAEELVMKFEDKDGGAAGDVRIYYPQDTQADDLAQMIRQAIPGVASPRENAAGSATKARLIVDAAQNRLIVAAPIAGQLDAIENLINRVDKPIHGSGSSVRSQSVQVTKVFRPRASDAASVAKILTDALTKRVPGGSRAPSATVTVEATSQSVVVTGSPGDVQTAVDIISQLENGSMLPMPQQTKFIDVGTLAEAKRILPLIEQIYRSQLNDSLGGQTAHAKILTDPETGRLIVTASEEHVMKIEAIVKQLKGERTELSSRGLRILSLKHLRVDSALPTINSLVAERLSEKQFEDDDKPLVVPDAANNRLLVTCTDAQLEAIQQVLNTLDVGPEKGQREMRVIPVQSKSASELIALTTQLMNQLGEAQPNPQLAPMLIPDASGKQIIVLAAPQDLARVTNLVHQLDSASASTARQFRAIELFSRTATELTPLVQQLYQEQLKGQTEPGGGPATLLAETKNNRIMVSGSDKEIVRVEQIIRQLDPEGLSGDKDETRVIRLKAALAGELATLVEKSLSAQAQQVKVLVDARSNSLVITGESRAVEAASQIIQQLDTQSDVQPRELRLIELKSAEASSVAPMVTSLFADIIKDQRGPEYKTQAKIVPDPSGNRLIVTGSKDELKTVAGLVEQLDQQPETAGMARVFKLNMADASSMVSVVSNAMVRFDARNRPIRLVSVSADEKSNSLIVSGSRSDLQDAQAIIERLDGEGVDAGRTLKIMEVATDDPDALATLAMNVFTAQNSGRNVAAVVSITPEPSGKRLIILAPASLIPQVETVVTTLDAKPEQGARELQTIELKTASAQKLLPTVQRIYKEQTQGKTIKPATIYPDGTGTRLLVYGNQDQGAIVRQIVETMISNEAQPRETRAFDVGRPEDVQRLVPLVQQLYQEQWKERGETDPADAKILGDARTGRLMVTGKPEHIKQIELILEQLNAGQPRADSRDTRIYDLTTASAAELANTVRTLYLEESKSRLGTLSADVLILPDASANRLIITGDTNEVQAVEAIIHKLDKVSAQSGSVRVFKLKYADPAKVMEILGNTLTSYDSYGRARRRVGVTLDAKSRSIIVAGDPKELQSLQNAAIIIEQLDAALGEQAERKIKVLTLTESKVGEMMPKVRQLYDDQLASKPELSATQILMLEDAPGNQIILAGSEAQLELVETIVGQLQTATVKKGARQTKLIEMGQADEMQRMLPLIQQLYREHWRDKVAGDPADAQIMADPRNARLIVTARTNHIAEIESIIAKLRSGTTEQGPRDTRIYDLTTATAMELATTVRSLYQEQTKNRPGVRAEDTSILPDASANRLIVTASTNELALVEDIIMKLDKVSAQSGSVRVFKLKYADPAKVMEILGNTLTSYDSYGRARRRVGVTLDAKSRSIIVAGDPKELQSLQNAAIIIEQLDAALGEQAERKIKVLTLTESKVGEMMPKVRQLYDDQLASKPELSATQILMLEDAPGNQIILAGSEAQLELVETIVGQLQTATVKKGARQTKLIEMGQADEMQRMLPLIQQLYREHWRDKVAGDPADAQIMADPRNARLIVTARTNHIAEIESIIAKLRSGTTEQGPRDTRIYDLTTATAMELATTVRSLYQEQTKNRPGVRAEDTSILPDASANRLIVTASTNELALVEDIIMKLDKVSAQSASVRVFKVKSAEPEKVAEILSNALVSYDSYGRPRKRISVSVDPKSRTIIAAGDPKELQGVSVIVEQLDSTLGSQPERKMKVLPVKSGNIKEFITKLRAVYEDQVTARPELGTSDILILEDRTSNQLILAGSDNQLQLIEDIAGQLDLSATVLEERETRVYELTSTSAQELVATVKSLYQEAIKGNPPPPASQALLLPDVNANRLIVSATTNDLKVIDDIIQKIDKTEAQTGRTRVFKLRSAEAQQVATILSTALVQLGPYGRSTPRVSVGSDTQNNLLIVSGAPQDLQSAAVIVEQMDQMLAREPRQLRVVTLKTGLASEVANRVKQLYQDQLKGQVKTSPADATILGDDVSSRLIITATESHMKLIEEIVGKLQETGEGSGRQLRVVGLQRNSAASIAAMITQLFRLQVSSRDPSQRLAVSASDDDRTLVLDAAGPLLLQVEELVKTLDGEEALGKVEVRTYQMPEGNATDLASTLARLFAEKAGSSGSALAPKFEADGTANVIMVAATKDQFIQIDQLIEDLKKTARVSSEIRTFKLQNGDPTQIAEVLQSMLTDGESQPRPRRMQWRPGVGLMPVTDAKSVRVAPARSLNAVVVQGPPEKLALAQKLIESLDSDDTDARSVIQTVRLTKAQAENVADAVNKTIAGRGPQTRLNRVTVTPVVGPNSLLLNGPADAVQEVMQVIHELDLESESSEIKVHIYKLENGNAREVSSVIQQLLQNVTRGQMRLRSVNSSRAAGQMVQPSVSVDERSNSLVISGTEAHFKVVEQLLSTLDKVPERSERDVQFVWLRNAKAFDVALKLDAVFEARPASDRPVIDADLFNNSITIIGKRADIVQVQDLIARLDESSKDTSMQVRMRPLDTVPVEQMARMLQNIYPQVSAGVIRVVEKVQPPAQPGTGASVIAPLEGAAPKPADQSKDPAKQTDEELAIPEVVVAIDKTANALILSGPTHELDQIDHIISELSYSYVSSDAEFRVFPLKEADPLIVARTLTELFRPEQVRVQPQQQGQGQRQGEVRVVAPPPKITAVAEPRTRSVIVRAKPTDFILMESLINQLDVNGVSSELEFRVVTLTNAPPQKIVPLVQQMVTQLKEVRPGEPLSVTPDPRSRGFLVVARDAVLKQVESMIRSLDTPAQYSEAEVLVVSLKKSSASQLATVLQNMLKPGAQGEATPDARELQEQVRRLRVKDDQGQEVLLDLAKPIRIMSDPMTGGQGGNRLILSSTPDNLKALAAVVEMMDSVPVSEGVHVRLFHLDFADAATVAQTLTSIFAQGQRLGAGPGGRSEPEGIAGKALVNPLNVAVDRRSNAVILSGQKESLELAEKVINDLDSKVDRFITEVKLFRLKHASARRLAPLLQSVFSEGPSVPGTEGLTTQITRLRAVLPGEQAPTTEQPKSRSAMTVQADDSSNIIIIAARSDTLPLIEAIINQLDIPPASGMDTLRIYALNHADPAVVRKVIMDLHSGPRANQLRPEDIPNITIDDRTQAMFISGNEKAFALVDGLIPQLDKELPLELRDVRIIPLDNADAGTVASSLQRLLDARVTQRAALGRQQAEALRVLVIPESRSNSLLVAGSKDSFELVESLARELDAAPPALSGRIRLVPLVYADARSLSMALINLFNQRYQSARSPETQRNRPVIVADSRSNALLIAAGVDDSQTIDDLISRLDQQLDDPSMVLTVIGLRHNNATTVAGTLENIFTARQRSRTVPGQPASPREQIDVEPDSMNNSLIVSASRENLELIVGLLEKIDVEPVVADGVVQTFTLEFADAQRAANMLRSLVQQGLYRPGAATGRGGRSTREAMAVTVDARSNTLVVSASPENIAVIKEVIRQLDTKDFAQDGNIRLYQLKHARASSLATVLEQFFRARRASEAGLTAAERSIPVTVVPDDRMNALLVTGGKESFDVIDRMIQQLDGEDTQARMNFRVFILKQTTASKLQSTLQRLFTNRPSRIKGEPLEPISIVADSWVNALIVGASIDDMSMVESLVERLDSDQAEMGVTVQVFAMAKADARRVAQVIQGLYREGGTGAAFPVVITADERMNAIIVSAGEGDLKRIGDLVKKLDTDQVGRVAEIRIFPLKHARADSISLILNTALNTKPASLTGESPNSASLLQFIARAKDGGEFVASALKEGVLITPDSRMNSLVVSAPVDYMNLLDQIISRLDSSTPQQAKIKVFSLVNADARMMAELLMSLFRLQPSGQPSGMQRAIQYTLVRESLPGNGGMNSAPGRLGLNDDVEVASATLGSDEQGALHVTVDQRTNSLLVGGTEHYVGLVSEIIESLDSSEAQERKSDVYRLRNAQASDIAGAVRDFLDQDRERITQVLGAEAVGTAQRMLEREVAIVAETNSNTLLISASPRYFPQVTNLVISLDQPRPQVLIQVLLAEVTLDDTRDLGVEWDVTKTVEDAKLATGTAFGVPGDLKSYGGFSAAVTGSDYNFLIRALQNDGRLQILSRPQILTADNQPANINVGQRVPLISNSGTTPQGGTLSTIDYQNVGVHLQVTPRIGADGAVRMEISTTNSALTSSSVNIPSGSDGGTVSMPIINERRASTSVSVQSGQSILIGGLIETMEDSRIKKIPYLGDIPGLGVLFRSKTRVTSRKELLILLTPQVLLMGDQPERLGTVEAMTQQQLERSSIKDQIQRDDFRDRLLEPLYPNGLNLPDKEGVSPADRKRRRE